MEQFEDSIIIRDVSSDNLVPGNDVQLHVEVQISGRGNSTRGRVQGLRGHGRVRDQVNVRGRVRARGGRVRARGGQRRGQLRVRGRQGQVRGQTQRPEAQVN